MNCFIYAVGVGAAMGGSVMVSYSKARAESLIGKCDVGFWERPERIALMILGAVSSRMELALWILAIGPNITVVHRIIYTWKRTTDHSPARREQLMKLWCDAEVLRLTNMRASQKARAGNPGPEGSIAKLAYSHLNKSVYEWCIDTLGPAGVVDYDYTFRRPSEALLDGAPGSARKLFLRSRANSIEGGTSEIMRNILGERILGLPGEPRVDRDLPWSQVPRS